jgi:hypothetical protein
MKRKKEKKKKPSDVTQDLLFPGEPGGHSVHPTIKENWGSFLAPEVL